MVTTVTKAINAYNKTLQNNANTKPADGLVRSLNDFAKTRNNNLKSVESITNAANVIARAQADASTIVTFPQAVSNAMQEHLEKVRQGEKTARKAVNNNGLNKPDEIEILAAINESESAFNRIVVLRDKLVAAYQEVLKMPI
jgi:flagellar hook-basal body complex protein FliE